MGCVTLAGIAGVLLGLILLFYEPTEDEPRFIWMLSVFYGGAGVLVTGLGLYGLRLRREEERYRTAHPDEPWLWRRAWREGVSKPHDLATVLLPAVFAVGCFIISLPVSCILREQLLESVPLLLGMLVLFALGCVFLFQTVRPARLWLRNRRTVFKMDSVPGVIGGQLTGTLFLPPLPRPTGDARIYLECGPGTVRRWCSTGPDPAMDSWDRLGISGNDPVWDHPEAGIPVAFSIPEDQPPTDINETEFAVRWRVRVEIPLPDTDIVAEYEVPVFRTPDSPPAPDEVVFPLASETGGQALAADMEGAPDPARAGAELRDAGIQTRPCSHGGIALVFPAGRRNPESSGLLILGALMTLAGAVGLCLIPLTVARSKPFSTAFLGCVIGVFFLCQGIMTRWGKTVVEVCAKGVGTRTSFTGRSPRRWTPFYDVMGLKLDRWESWNPQGVCSLVLVRRTKPKETLVRGPYFGQMDAIVTVLQTAINDYRHPAGGNGAGKRD